MSTRNTPLSTIVIPVFTGENYDFWSIRMRTYFLSQDLWNIVESGFSMPENTTTLSPQQQEELKEGQKKDATALFAIQQAVDDTIFHHIMGAMSAKGAWDTLKQEFQSNDELFTAQVYERRNTLTSHRTMHNMAHPENAVAQPVDGNVNLYSSPNDGNRPLDVETGNPSSRRGTTTAASSSSQSQAETESSEETGGYPHNYYRPLYQAAIRGDWKSACSFIGTDPGALTDTITPNGGTLLMAAAEAWQWEFVLKLVEILPPEELKEKNFNGLTVLHFAAMGGNLRTVKALVRKNSALPQITGDNGFAPILFSLTVANPCKELVWYLCLVTRDEHPSNVFTGRNAGCLVDLLVNSGFHDITFYLRQHYSRLATEPAVEYIQCGGTVLFSTLSHKSSDFLSGSKLTFWERWIWKVVRPEVRYLPPQSVLRDVVDSLENSEDYEKMLVFVQPRSITSKVMQWLRTLLWKATEKLVPCIIKVVEAKSKHNYAVELVKHVCKQLSDMDYLLIWKWYQEPLAIATESGVVEIIDVFLQYFPDLFFLENKQNSIGLFKTAIEFRHDKIIDLLMNKTPTQVCRLCMEKDENKNTTLHIVAKLPPPTTIASIPGAALQMQREFQWFKAMERLTNPPYKQSMNMSKKTAMVLFTEEHKDLAEKGEKWMKDTSNSGMLVSTLVATVVFAAAFTVPGGNTNDKGTPIFLRKDTFALFAVSEALALFSSITSVLMFLSVLTARYTFEDFLFSLPNKIIIGLGSLFLAIATMMTAFGSALYIVLNERWQWVSFPIIILAAFPVTLFVMLQLPLLFQMIKSTYGGGIGQWKSL